MESLRQYGAFAAAAVVGLAGFALGDYAQLAWLGAAVLVCLGIAQHTARWGVFATGLLGMGASGYLLYRKVDPSGAAICNVSEVVNCDKVNTSAASELLGLPIALYGTAYFLGVALAAVVLRPGPGARLFQTVGLLSAVGSVYSVYLAYETVVLRATCPFCLTIYACCFLLVGIAVAAAPSEDEGGLLAGIRRVPGSSAFLVVAATFVFGVLFGQTFVREKRTAGETIERIADAPRPSPQEVANELAGTYGRPKGTIVFEGDEPLLGKATARFQVLEFADFGCPHCAQSFPLLHELVGRYPNDVAVRFRVFPLSGACNPALADADRAEVCRAAMAAQCAHRQGKFWEYAGTLFANQRYLAGSAEQLIAEAATQVAIDVQPFSDCLQDEATLDQVRRDAVAGAAMQIPGTPAFFVKGLVADSDEWVEVCAGPEAIVALILSVLEGAKLDPPTGPCADDGHGH